MLKIRCRSRSFWVYAFYIMCVYSDNQRWALLQVIGSVFKEAWVKWHQVCCCFVRRQTFFHYAYCSRCAARCVCCAFILYPKPLWRLVILSSALRLYDILSNPLNQVFNLQALLCTVCSHYSDVWLYSAQHPEAAHGSNLLCKFLYSDRIMWWWYLIQCRTQMICIVIGLFLRAHYLPMNSSRCLLYMGWNNEEYATEICDLITDQHIRDVTWWSCHASVKSTVQYCKVRWFNGTVEIVIF